MRTGRIVWLAMLVSASGVHAGALEMALGDTGVGSNPARLAGTRNGDFFFTHHTLESGLTRQGTSFALRTHQNVVAGLALEIVRRNAVPTPEQWGGLQGDPGDFGYAAQLVLARQLGAGWSAGVAGGRLETRPERDGRAKGWVTDLGFSWKRGSIRLGAALTDTRWGLEDARGRLPYRYRALARATRSWFEERVQVVVQVDRERGRTPEGALGAEWWAHRSLAVRVAGRRSVASTGLGFRSGALGLDYVLRVGPQTEHVVSAHLGFGSHPRHVSAPRPQEVAAPVPGPFVVTAGSYATLEIATTQIFRLHEIGIRPHVEWRGSGFLVVVRRTATYAEAVTWQARAKRSGFAVTIEPE